MHRSFPKSSLSFCFPLALIVSSKALPFSDFLLLPSILKELLLQWQTLRKKECKKGLRLSAKRNAKKGSASFCFNLFHSSLFFPLFPLYMVASGSFVFPSIVCALLYSNLL
ncbi:hypothetical protein QL285_022087 [Trifolium repens]|nr:hypothetical protein QL285_022087 [Trifolium repens]